MDTVFKTAEIIKHPKSMIPKNRFGHCMIAVDELVIIYGGKTFEDSVLDELWMYDSVRQKWRLFCLPQLLKSTCFNSSICAHGSKIYIFGGTNLPGSEYIQTTLFSFDVRSFKWRNLFSHLNNSENRPRQIEMTNILYHNDSIYILGVVDVRYRNLVGAMYKFCLKTFKWSVIPYKGDVPHPNCKGHCTVFQNKMFYYKACYYGSGQFLKVRIFDLSTHTWEIMNQETEIDKYPGNRSCHAFIFNENYGYLVGGVWTRISLLNDCDVTDLLNGVFTWEIWRVDLETLEWIKLKNHKICLYEIRACLVDKSYLYYFGGRDEGKYEGLKKIIIGPTSLKFRCREVLGADEYKVNTLARILPLSMIHDIAPNHL